MSWLARLLLNPVKLVGFLIVALMVAGLIDYCVRNAPRVPKPFQAAEVRIQDEVELFQYTFSRAFPFVDPRPMAIAVGHGIDRCELELARLPPSNLRFVHQLQQAMANAAPAALSTIEVFALRCLALFATMPLIALACVVVGIDGYVRRQVRKAGAGFESARIYHLAKRSIQPILVWACLFYLAMPMVFDVRWVYGILTVALPVLVGIAVSRFKKYI